VQLGAIRLTNLFFLKDENGPVPRNRYKLIRQYVYNRAIRVIQRFGKAKYKTAVGSSGTIENLADIVVRMSHDRKRTSDDVLTREQLKTVISRLCELPLEKRRQMPGINANRADIIIAGAAILDGLMKALSINELRISDSGVQHGLLVDYLASNQHDLHAKPYTVRERSVLKLGRSCQFDEPHARHVADLALELFDSGKEEGLHTFGEWERELLLHAALLHDVGMFVAYNSHEAHTYYLILHANLLGFDQTETAIMASTAYFHRKRFPRKKHPEFASLDKRSGRIVRVLATFLRMAESLDRSHTNAIEHVKLVAGKDEVVLEIRAEKGTQLEEWNIPQRAEDFERVFEKPLVARKT
jgi:exopolyphosphatase/guanosine-5'-triphosphate,3'-diphosphate pyrophosphatase